MEQVFELLNPFPNDDIFEVNEIISCSGEFQVIFCIHLLEDELFSYQKVSA